MICIDMQMPNNCFVCQLNAYGECIITDKSVPDYDEDETIIARPSECPLHDKPTGRKDKTMFFINQYIMDDTGKLTKAAYDRETQYEADAEYFRRHGEAMNKSTTVWVLTTMMDDNGAVFASKKSVKPAEEPTGEA